MRRGRPSPSEDIDVKVGVLNARVTALPLNEAQDDYHLTVTVRLQHEDGLHTALGSATGRLTTTNRALWAAEIDGARLNHTGTLDGVLALVGRRFGSAVAQTA